MFLESISERLAHHVLDGFDGSGGGCVDRSDLDASADADKPDIRVGESQRRRELGLEEVSWLVLRSLKEQP